MFGTCNHFVESDDPTLGTHNHFVESDDLMFGTLGHFDKEPGASSIMEWNVRW